MRQCKDIYLGVVIDFLGTQAMWMQCPLNVDCQTGFLINMGEQRVSCSKEFGSFDKEQ